MAHNLLHSEVVFVLIFVAVFVCLLAYLFLLKIQSTWDSSCLAPKNLTCLNLTSANEVQKVNMGALL